MEHVGIERNEVEEALAPDLKGRIAHQLADCLACSALEVAYVVADWLGQGSGRDNGSMEMVGHYRKFLLFEKRLLSVKLEPFVANDLAEPGKMGFVVCDYRKEVAARVGSGGYEIKAAAGVVMLF